MPLDGTLIKVKRTGEHTWQNYEALEVLFTNLIVPEKCSFNTIQFRKYYVLLNWNKFNFCTYLLCKILLVDSVVLPIRHIKH
jgi:hypothetical protein